MRVISILKCFPCLLAPIGKQCFSIFGSGVSVSIGSGLVGSLSYSNYVNYFFRLLKKTESITDIKIHKSKHAQNETNSLNLDEKMNIFL
jgi:hypothetical protein